MSKINKWLISVIVLITLVLGLSGYVVYDKLIKDYNNVEEKALNVSEEEFLNIGLELYKFATGNGTGPFRWEDGNVVNYVEVISKFTQEYFDSSISEKGFSIPYKDFETGEWKSYGGFGISYMSKFKAISIESQSENVITFNITY